MKEMLINITGDVQGVSFRWHAKNQAEHLGLCGWAKNQPDSSLLILIQGSSKKINEFIDWCRQGPPLAKPEKIIITKRSPQNKLKHFDIVH